MGFEYYIRNLFFMSEKEIKDTQTKFSAKEVPMAFLYGGILGTILNSCLSEVYIQTQRTKTNKRIDFYETHLSDCQLERSRCIKQLESQPDLHIQNREQKSRITVLQASYNLCEETLQEVTNISQDTFNISQDTLNISQDMIAELRKSLNTCLNDGYIQTDK